MTNEIPPQFRLPATDLEDLPLQPVHSKFASSTHLHLCSILNFLFQVQFEPWSTMHDHSRAEMPAFHPFSVLR